MEEVQALYDRLNSRRRLRVWSIIITFFGDAIMCRGGAVSAKTVQDILLAMGIEAGTVRTAFSRLVQDKWVERTKIGRVSHYRLTPEGIAPFATATERIYAPYLGSGTDAGQENWLILERQNLSRPRLVRDARTDFHKTFDDNTFVARITPNTVPDWMKTQLCTQEHREGLTHLIADFESVAVENLSPLDALLVRCLLIHEWRRIALLFDPVPEALQTNDWPERRCLSFVSNLFHQLLERSEDWLSKNATGPNGPLPEPVEDLSKRFE